MATNEGSTVNGPILHEGLGCCGIIFAPLVFVVGGRGVQRQLGSEGVVIIADRIIRCRVDQRKRGYLLLSLAISVHREIERWRVVPKTEKEVL